MRTAVLFLLLSCSSFSFGLERPTSFPVNPTIKELQANMTSGYVPLCLSFTGAAWPSTNVNYVRIPYNARFSNLSAMTVEFWYCHISGASGDPQGDEETIVGPEYGGWGVSIANGRLVFSANNATINLPQITYLVNQWQHVAFVYDNTPSGSQLKAFVDGILVSTQTGAPGPVGPEGRDIVINRHVWVSGYPPFYSSRITARIDEMRISDVARYSSDFHPPPSEYAVDPHTVALYHFNEGGGTTIVDASRNALNGVIVGSMTWPGSTPVVNPAEVALKDGLVACYPFNGNANDESGNNLNATVYRATLVFDRFNIANKAYDFDLAHAGWGTRNDDVYIPYSPLLNVSNITVSVWVYPRSYAWSGNPRHGSRIVTRYENEYSNPNGKAWGIGFDSCSVSAGIYQASTTHSQDSAVVSYGEALSLNSWSHIVMSYDGAVLKLYVNGAVVSATNTALPMNTAGISGISVGESDQASGYWQYCDGVIDDIRIYGRSLSIAEIGSLYCEGGWVTPPRVRINAISYLDFTAVQVNGAVTPNGKATTVWFEYGTDPVLAAYTSTIQQPIGSGLSSVSVAQALASLSPGTTYYCRAAAWTTAGVVRSSILSFTTLQAARGTSDPASSIPLTPGTVVDSAGIVQNIRPERIGGQWIISYDLMGVKDKVYVVSVKLKREDNSFYEYTPRNISGDVGDKVIPGIGKRIVWEAVEEMASLDSGDVYYFYVEAAAAEGGVSVFVWIGAGVALLGGAALLFSSKKGSGAKVTSDQGVPSEPERPE